MSPGNAMVGALRMLRCNLETLKCQKRTEYAVLMARSDLLTASRQLRCL